MEDMPAGGWRLNLEERGVQGLNDPGGNVLYMMLCGCGSFEIWKQNLRRRRCQNFEHKEININIVNTGWQNTPE
jgi:hypothetical protein